MLLRKPEFQELFKQYIYNHQSAKGRKSSDRIMKEKSGKIITKSSNTSSKGIKSKRMDNTIRHSRETIVHYGDYSETINYHQLHTGEKQKNFFKS